MCRSLCALCALQGKGGFIPYDHEIASSSLLDCSRRRMVSPTSHESRQHTAKIVFVASKVFTHCMLLCVCVCEKKIDGCHNSCHTHTRTHTHIRNTFAHNKRHVHTVQHMTCNTHCMLLCLCTCMHVYNVCVHVCAECVYCVYTQRYIHVGVHELCM